MRWKEGADERLMQAIVDNLEEPGMLASFVVVANIVRMDGDADLCVNAAVGQRSADTLGLLRAATIIEEEGLVRAWFEDE